MHKIPPLAELGCECLDNALGLACRFPAPSVQGRGAALTKSPGVAQSKPSIAWSSEVEALRSAAIQCVSLGCNLQSAEKVVEAAPKGCAAALKSVTPSTGRVWHGGRRITAGSIDGSRFNSDPRL